MYRFLGAKHQRKTSIKKRKGHDLWLSNGRVVEQKTSEKEVGMVFFFFFDCFLSLYSSEISSLSFSLREYRSKRS